MTRNGFAADRLHHAGTAAVDFMVGIQDHSVQMINKLDRFDPRDGAAPDLGLRASAASGGNGS